MNEKKPTLIKISPAGMDDLFIMKHKYEKEHGLQKHIVYDEFLYNTIAFGKDSFYDGTRKEAVPFSIVTLKDGVYIIYAVSNDDVEKDFLQALEIHHYDLSSLQEIDALQFNENTSQDFFAINGKMLKA